MHFHVIKNILYLWNIISIALEYINSCHKNMIDELNALDKTIPKVFLPISALNLYTQTSFANCRLSPKTREYVCGNYIMCQ